MDAGHLEADRGPYVAGEGTIRALAEAAVLGLPVEQILRTRDGDERSVWDAVRQEAASVKDTELRNLARYIVEEYAKARNRGEKQS